MASRVDRRQFVQQTAAATGLAAVGVHSSLAPAASRGANEEVRIAGVGVANKGGHNLDQLVQDGIDPPCRIVALCDIDANFLEAARARYGSEARHYRDFRKMLEEEAAGIDAVIVSTADHTHAPATCLALSMKKAVYCEKPLTHTVHEARTVARLARENNVTTQMGTQIHASDNYRRVVETVRSGIVGEVHTVYTWCNKDWSGAEYQPWDGPPPAHVDWDLWQGPAPERPYSPGIHPYNWRKFWNYGGGTFGDMGCHIQDLAFWALGIRHPQTVEAEGPPLDEVSSPAWCKATYTYAATESSPAITLHWSDGGAHFDFVEQTNDHGGNPLSSWGLGVLFVGEDGMVAADYGRLQLLPKDRFEESPPIEQTIPPSPGHWREFVDGIRNGTPTLCNFEYAGALTENVLLGIVAYKTGKKLEWDAAALRATNCPEADAHIRKEYRRNWELVG